MSSPTIFATAPTSIGRHMLGRPYDATFQPLVGPTATPLFGNDDANIVHTNVDAFRHNAAIIEDTVELSANASAWGIASANIGVNMRERYATQRAYQIKYVEEVDDTQSMESAPDGAVYYLARIYYGHLYESVAHVDARRFEAGLLAKFVAGEGQISAWASQNRVEMSTVGRGLRPRSGEAVFARDAAAVEAAYVADGPPVPIFVDYRVIPRPQAGALAATAITGPETVAYTMRFELLSVVEDGTLGTSTWELRPWCKVAGEEVPLEAAERPVWRSSEVDTATYRIGLTEHVRAAVGDVIECGTGGLEREDGEELARGSFRVVAAAAGQPTLGVSSNLDWSAETPPTADRTTGRFAAGNGDTSYTVAFEVSRGIQ